MNQGATARSWGVIAFCSVVSLIVGGATVYFTVRPKPEIPLVVSTPAPPPTPCPTPSPAPIRVYVSGAVRQAAVYRLPAGSIVEDAIEAAGGPAPDAALDRINLALELRDQQQVYVPTYGEESALPPISGNTGTDSAREGLIDINTATAETLEMLPRIGPATAQKIVAYREANGPFANVADLQDVPGIGPATLDGLKDLVTVGP